MKVGGILLVVGMENCVPVVVTTVDGNTVAAVFWEIDWYEVVSDSDDDGDGNTGDDFVVDVTVNPDLGEDSLMTREDGTWVKICLGN